MSFHVNTYSIGLGFATVLIALVSSIAWRNRDRPGSAPFLVLLFGVGLWAFGSTFQLAATDLDTKLAFRTLAYFGHNLVPIAVLVFALAYTGRSRWLNRRRIALLAAEPMAVALVLTPTNALGYHDLIWTEMGIRTLGSLAVFGREFGPMYWVNTAYNYVLVLVAVYLFAQLVLESRHTGKRQGMSLLVAAIPPFLANVFWIGGLTAIDYTPFAFVITAVAFAFAMYRFGLFDVVPLAQETILDAIRDGYVVIDDRGRVLDLNEPARERMAIASDPVGKPIEAVIPELGDALDAVTGAESSHEELVLERDAGPMYVDMEVTALQGRSGKLLILRDVTAQRRVERRYRRLIENSSDLIAVLDDEGQFTYASPSWAEVMDLEPSAIVGESAFEYVHPEDREAAWAEFERALEEPDYVAEAEYRFERGDGTWVWLSSKGTNLFDDPFVEGFVVNTREVTQRKHRERALEQQNQRLDEFTSAVSHDLRNPLNVIQGRLDLARETGDPEHFDAIENAAGRMETLISDLLQLARQGQLVGETEAVQLGAAAEEAWENIETRSATLEVEDGGPIEADPDRLYQLLENLFGNAVEHGGEAVSIRVGSLPEGFYVEDDGPGIPPEDRTAVFERGYSTGEEGTGFGLSIVASIASAHGWSIEVTAGDLGGARFEITEVDRPAVPDED